ncbi:Rha family transcriptional regulator, partial [Clostridium botulinum]
MTSVQVLNNNKGLVLDSREVAEMMEVEHWQILRKLEGTEKVKGIIPTLADNKIVVSQYFIESTYKDNSGKENKCYLFTKMGCEFIANKFTGEKGILFTAKYVNRFNEMEQQLNDPLKNYLNMSEEDRAIAYFTKMKEAKELEIENREKDELLLVAGQKTQFVDDFLNSKEAYTIDAISKILGIKELGRNNFYKYLRENRILMTDIY